MSVFRYLVLILLLGSNYYAHAGETLQSPKDARVFADQVMARVATGQLDAAIAEMKRYTIVPEAEIDATLGQFKLQLPAIAQRFGSVIGSEFVREDKVGDSLIRIVYLQRFDRHAMKWLFYFYRGSNGWILNTFRFDDNILSLFP